VLRSEIAIEGRLSMRYLEDSRHGWTGEWLTKLWERPNWGVQRAMVVGETRRALMWVEEVALAMDPIA